MARLHFAGNCPFASVRVPQPPFPHIGTEQMHLLAQKRDEMAISAALGFEHAAGPTMVLELRDVVGLADLGALRRALKSVLRSGCTLVIVELAQVRDLDAACLSSLVSLARRLRHQGGSVLLRRCPPELMSELRLRGWDKCFDVTSCFDDSRPLACSEAVS